ncbi:MAG: 4Fe-4S binding protein [Planctomycetes bacterium]|nr:4Fe-4S binding protein [Planctomycetota bacterium]
MEVRVREGFACAGLALGLILAGAIGFMGDREDVQLFLRTAMTSADQFVAINDHLYQGQVQEGGQAQPVGLVSLGIAPGYAGPIKTAVAWTSDLSIHRVVVARQTETKAFYRKLRITSLLETWRGKACTDPFQIGQDIEAVTGATVSLQGLSESVRQACQTTAIHAGIPVVESKRPPVRLGFPEAVLALLYGVGCLAYLPGLRARRTLRWLGLTVGLLGLGFWLNRPVSLVQINTMLLGHWPLWRTHLYWYLLIGGVLLPTLLTGRSIYCSHACPMAAVQAGLSFVGGKRFSISPRITVWLRGFQRVLTLGVVIVALIFRNPVLAQYEITGTLFGLTGTWWQFSLLALVLIASLFWVRPWCLILCPVHAVLDTLRMVRRGVLGRRKTKSPDDLPY